MFQRIGPKAFKKDLNNIRILSGALGNPEKKFNSIHIAGTNGKGTVAHMVAAVLQEAGYKTGLYTSPHYRDFRERIKVNGRLIPKKEVVRFTDWFRASGHQMEASFFEISVAMAFDHFAREAVDIAVVEVGLGGRLDSTNIIKPILSVITNIGWDHTEFLGNSLRKIAREKAGIIKEEVPVLIGEYQPGPYRVFEEVASMRSAPLFLATRWYSCREEKSDMNHTHYVIHNKQSGRTLELNANVFGLYQHNNVITALSAIELLKEEAGYSIPDSAVFSGFENLRALTGYLGRWQVLQLSPLALCDSAHNREGVRYLVSELKKLKAERMHIVFGMVGDKDLDPVLSLLPGDACYYFAKADVPRGMPAGKLSSVAKSYGLKGKAYPSVKSAYAAALEAAGQKDVVFVGGSIFVVAEVV